MPSRAECMRAKPRKCYRRASAGSVLGRNERDQRSSVGWAEAPNSIPTRVWKWNPNFHLPDSDEALIMTTQPSPFSTISHSRFWQRATPFTYSDGLAVVFNAATPYFQFRRTRYNLPWIRRRYTLLPLDFPSIKLSVFCSLKHTWTQKGKFGEKIVSKWCKRLDIGI